MASSEYKVTVQVDAQELIAELKAAQEAPSEERIRKIVREELAAFEKRQVHELRFGKTIEVK